MITWMRKQLLSSKLAVKLRVKLDTRRQLRRDREFLATATPQQVIEELNRRRTERLKQEALSFDARMYGYCVIGPDGERVHPRSIIAFDRSTEDVIDRWKQEIIDIRCGHEFALSQGGRDNPETWGLNFVQMLERERALYRLISTYSGEQS